MAKTQTTSIKVRIKCACMVCGATNCLLLLDATGSRPAFKCLACYVTYHPDIEDELTIWLYNHKKFRGG